MEKITLKRLKFLWKQILKGNFKNVLRYKLWLIGYQETLPSFVIRSIPIIESNESLVTISKNPRVICEAPNPFVRQGVEKMLHLAASNLPKGLSLKILYAFRDQKTQKIFWEEVVKETRLKNPIASEEEVLRIASSLSAKPGGIGPHQTGGAVDVTIVDEFGNDLLMGTDYRDHNNLQKVPMFSKQCNSFEKKNRKILRDAMLGAGFYFYPGEWWHYSYGDQAWAAYVGNENAIYGEVNLS